MKLAHLFICLVSAPLFAAPTSNHNSVLANEYCYLAQRMQEVGDDAKAFDYYKKALELDENNPIAHTFFGINSYAKKDTKEATKHFEVVTQQKPKDVHAHYDLGLSYLKDNKKDLALKEFNNALAIDPAHESSLLHIATIYEQEKKYDQAINTLKKAIQMHDNSYSAYHKLACIYRTKEDLQASVRCFSKALALQPNNLQAMMDLANTLNMLDHNQEALELYEKIVEKNPNAVSALYNFGYTLKKLGKFDQALRVYDQVLAKKPDYAHAHFSSSSIYLMQGNYERGWQEYEWRWKAYGEQSKKFNRPVWQGEDLQGKTLLVYAEQGLGDTFQFIRFIKELKATHPDTKIVFECQTPLKDVLSHQPYFDHLFARNENPPFAHYQIALLSLPFVLKTDVQSIPTDIPYIKVPDNLVHDWQEKLQNDTNFKVGICWQGNARYNTLALRKAVAAKSIALEKLAPLFDVPNVSIYSLQKVDGIDQIEDCSFKNKLIVFDGDFDRTNGRFMDTAAVMRNLDLVISVDTGVCHLAGGLGVPTWIVLQWPNDWRWMLERSDSVWYPNVRLFRQPQTGDWESPVQQMAIALNQLVNTKKRIPITQPEVNKKNYLPTTEQKLFFENLIDRL